MDSEAQASRRGGRKFAAQDALRLYERLAEYFPKSPYAGGMFVLDVVFPQVSTVAAPRLEMR